MSGDELKILLESKEVTFRRVAIDHIVMSFPTHADLFFAAFHNNDELAVEMANAARQWMPVLRDGYNEHVSPFESIEEYSIFRNLSEFYSVFLDEMHKDLEKMDETTALKTVDVLWRHFPGLRVDLKGVKENNTLEEHRQLMVFVTGNCNMHCPYCFSKELQKLSISKTDMERILSWAQSQHVKTLLPCGGEPLMYEHMDWLIREIEQCGMKMYFATNLSVRMPDALLKGKDNHIGQLHVHLTDELFNDKLLMSTFRNNLRLCRENGIDVILRGNIYGDDVRSHSDEWFEIAKEFEIIALNVALAIPSHTGSNRFVHFEAMQAMVPRLRQVWEWGKENGILVSLAKPLPLCMFPEELALDILRHNHNAAFCNVNEDCGMHNLSLSTDMRFSPCLGIDEPSIPFSDNLSWDTLRKVFSHTVCELQTQPLLKQCDSCFLYHRRLCQGACLSYKQMSRNGGVPCAS